MNPPTDAGVFVRLVYQAMRDAGIDADAVLARVGMSAAQINDPNLRTPHAGHKRFWHAVEEVSGDPHAGLHIGEHLPVLHGEVLEYLFLSSPTFGDGVKRAQRYQRLVSDAVEWSLSLDARECYLTIRYAETPPRHSRECLALGLIRFFRQISDGAFAPERVSFAHTEGAPAPEYRRVFGCDVTLGATGDRIYFDRLVLARPSPYAEPELLRLHEQVASNRVAALRYRDLVAEVQRIIAETLEDGDVGLEQVAARLGMKPRALRAQLEEAGTNFNDVFAGYRSRLAKRLLASTDETIDRIVYLTGFSEPSTFYRAFKRWVDETPVEYRRRKRGLK